MTDELDQAQMMLAEAEYRLKTARKTIDRMILERRRDLQYYRWALVGLVLVNCVFYGAWLADKSGWL